MSSTYQNYDFGMNWNEKIVPILLNDPNIQKILDAFENDPDETWDRKRNPPCFLSHWKAITDLLGAMLTEEKKNRMNPKLSREFWSEYDRIHALEKKQVYLDEDLHKESMKYHKLLMEGIGWSWEKNPTFIAFWIPFGRCHEWNLIFSFYLAKTVCPELKWEILTSDIHTTVICKETKQIFDILYWGLDRRLADYVFDRPYRSRDNSLGGNRAFKEASEKPKNKRKRGN